ncbi:MAG: NAD-binding protein [Clostridia bacterium]|nr:NAD-binding protein [Clostridia bacterium]
MNIVVAGGREEADFLIGSLLSKKIKLKVINNDANYSKYLSEKHNISVLNGDPSKEYILEDADILDYDVLVALDSSDADNFVTCQIAKKRFRVKKVVCTVANPANVDVFKKLGINNVISSAYSVARLLEQATTLENLVNTLSAEDEAFSMSEIIIEADAYYAGKQLKEVKLPSKARITCVIHKGKMVIPTGQTVIYAEDKVLLLSSKECHKEAIECLSGVRKNDKK